MKRRLVLCRSFVSRAYLINHFLQSSHKIEVYLWELLFKIIHQTWRTNFTTLNITAVLKLHQNNLQKDREGRSQIILRMFGFFVCLVGFGFSVALESEQWHNRNWHSKVDRGNLKINSKTKLGMTMTCIVAGSSDLTRVLVCVMKIMGKGTL